MSELTDKVDFNRVRYANCWEDADILLSSLNLDKNKKILCVASAGDNALAMLSTEPASVLAVDLSAPQLYLTELKQMSFRHLNHDELLAFLGIHKMAANQRLAYFERVNTSLSPAAKTYWQERKTIIEQGVIYHGKFEHYFELFRKWLLPLVHNKTRISELLQPKDNAAQEQFFNKQWNTWRWRTLMRFFFSKRIMGRYGRDPEFLKHVNLSVPQYIRQKAEQQLQSTLATQNYFLHFIFKGVFGNGLPFYLRAENFEVIKGNIDKLDLVQTDVHSVIQQQTFDACCLSNIFEYFSEMDFKETVRTWTQQLKPGARLAFWNLMAPRSFSETAPQSFKSLPTEAAVDKGFFYSRFFVEEKI